MCNAIIQKKLIPYTEESAISSWFGYEYQGKVTIWFVVDFIKRKLKENNIQDYNSLIELFSGYSLEIEGLEDFSVKYGKNYITINQVKSSNNDPLDYKALGQLILKIIVHNNEFITGSFHVVHSKFKLKDIKKTHEDLGEFYKDLLEVIEQLKTLKENEYKTVLSNHDIKGYNLINTYKPFIYSNFRDVKFEDLQIAVQEMKVLIKDMFEKYINNEDDFKTNIYSKVIVNSVIIDNLDCACKLIEKNIDEISELICENFSSYEVRLCLQEKIWQVLDTCKKMKTKGEVCFTELIKIFKSPNYKYIFKVKDGLIKELENYKTNNYYEKQCNNNNCAIEEFHKVLHGLDEESLIELIQNIVPHRKVHKNASIDETVITDVVFDTMCKISKIRPVDNLKIAGINNNKWYWAIAFTLNDKKLSEMLTNNRKNILLMLYEADFLIIKTTNSNESRISVTELTEEELDKIEKKPKYAKINSYKEIGIKSIAQAEKIFKGENENA